MGSGFAGKTVVVTGASAGIGRAAAREFARLGAVVVAMARSKERLDDLAAEPSAHGKIVPIVADAADDAAMAAAADRILAEFPVPDVVVANAGMGLDARFVDTTDEAVREVFELNVLGVFRTLRPFVPGMTARGSGRLLIVSSAVGKRGIPSYSAYSASKFALHGLADALRAELSGTGVSVGVICPSTTRTEFQDRIRRSGPGQKRVRLNSHSAESVAAAIVRMARSRRREVVLSPEAKLMTFLNAIAPGILDRILGRVLKQG